MARDIGHSLRRLGLDVVDMEYRSGAKVPRQMPRLLDWLSKSPDGGLLVDINGRVVTTGLVARASQERPGAFICFTFLTDTPLHFHDRLEKWPIDAIIGYVDRSFPDLINFMGYERPRFVFHPHGGPSVEPGRTTSQRDIDLLFIGNVAKVDPVQVHASRVFGDNRKLIELLISSHEAFDPSKTPFQTVLNVAATLGGDFNVGDIALVAREFELYSSNINRLKVLSALTRHELSVVGRIAEGTLERNRNVRSLGYMSYRQCVDLMSRAKILVNVVPSFPNGGHERIFYAMSQGAAVMTMRSTYLEGDVAAHGFVRFFDIKQGDISGQLDRLLGDLDEGRLDRDGMLKFYRDHHAWERRLAPVVGQARERFA